jgi:MscS family membrane protein
MTPARGRCRSCLAVAGSILVVLLGAVAAAAQQTASAPAARPLDAEPPTDALGRNTPRGTVIGFMAAARKGADQVAARYLNTTLQDEAAVELVRKLYVVLDTRLSVRLGELSDREEGSRGDLAKPDRDVVGTVTTGGGQLELVVQRVSRGRPGLIWLFSRETLDAIPEAYDQIDLVSVDRYLPAVAKLHVLRIRMFEWLTLLLVLPFCYRLIGALGRTLGRLYALARGRLGVSGHPVNLLPGPVRLILLVMAIRIILSGLDVPLVERQFWSVTATLLVTAAVVWLLLVLNAFGEQYLRRHLKGSAFGEIAAMVRFLRRIADGIVIAGGGLSILRYFGIDATAALAGFGIGGIAVALAAQKTLENVVGGVSIIFDKAVRVGDVVKVGDTQGTVDSIGLRSTRIRTLDRTMLSVPNGQVASVSIETLSARDKFWFHHIVSLRRETTAAQMRSVVDGVRDLIACDARVDADSIRVRFFRLGSFSLDVELFAYVFAPDLDHFFAIQQELLLRVMDIVENAGTAIAFPSQTLLVTDARSPAAAVQAQGLFHTAPTAHGVAEAT